MDGGRNRREEVESSGPRDIIPLLKWTDLPDSPRHYWVVDVTSTQCICLEFLGGGAFVLRDGIRTLSGLKVRPSLILVSY